MDGKLHQFRSVVRENGYAEADEYAAGSIAWFKKTNADVKMNAHPRLCIDSVTASATVFWQSAPAELNSKTFRTAASLKEWLESTSKSEAVVR